MKYLKKMALFAMLAALFCCLSMPVSAASLSAPKVSIKTVSSTGKVQISWKKVKQASKYRVYYSTQKSSGYSLLGTTSSTKLTHSSAQSGTTYYYYVRSVKGSKLSAKSKVVSATCDLPQPKIKLSNDAETGKIKICWDAIEGATKYQVYRATSKSGKYSLVRTTTQTSWLNTSASAGKTYYYKVRAVAAKSAANSAYSAISSRTCDCAQPKIAVSLTYGTPKISWQSVSGASKYEVYRATSKTGSYTRIKTTTSKSYKDTGAKKDKTYYYKVRAVASKSSANSVYSAIESIRTGETFVTAYVALPNVYIYQSPDSSTKSVMLKYMDEVQLGASVATPKVGTWARVKYNSKTYYAWLPAGVAKFTDKKSSFDYVSEENTALQNEVIQLALKYKDLPTYYTHGASTGEKNPENGKYGFDCSGFVSYSINTVMQKRNPLYGLSSKIEDLYKIGVAVSKTKVDTGVIYNDGFQNSFAMQLVKKADLQPGDVIFFKLTDNSKEVDHCGIYLGNNEFIHATSSYDGVCIMPLTDRYAENYVAAYRYFPAEMKPANQTLAATSWPTLFAERSDKSERIYSFEMGEEVTLLYTSSNDTWGYVRTQDGLEGYVLMKYFDLVTE